MTVDEWQQYLDRYHDERPGITERLLTGATSRHRDKPYPWLVEPLRHLPGPILDLACGSAPTRMLLPHARWIGVDASAGELSAAAAAGRGPLVRARAERLPIADGAAGAVCAAMCLQVVTPLDAVLAEVRRVLRTGGMLVALVPSRLFPLWRWRYVSGVAGWIRVMRALGVGSEAWPNPHARDGLAGLLRANGFTVACDHRRVFGYEIANPAAAIQLVDGLYLPDVEPARIHQARQKLAAWGSPGRVVPLPLRRVVAYSN